MAKKDPFDTFRQVTLSGNTNPLKDALHSEREPIESDPRVPIRPETNVTPSFSTDTIPAPQQKVSKNAERELVSFHIDKKLKRALGFVKFETGKSYGDLYTEAVEDLLKKYGK